MVLAGLALLLGGGEGLVRGGVALATRMRLPMAVVGAVVLGFGTSMPEMLTSVSAALAGSPGIAIGNVLGSNIANILLILGVAAVIAPVPAGLAGSEDRLWLAIATALGLGAVAIGATVGRVEGAALLAILAIYIWRQLGRDDAVEALPPIGGMGAGMIALTILGGLATLIAGAWLLVEGATGIARALGISETVIGLTIVAVGTSLPELATSVIAARRGEAGLALGKYPRLERVQPPRHPRVLTAVIVADPRCRRACRSWTLPRVAGQRRCCWRAGCRADRAGRGPRVSGALRGLHGVARARRCLIFLGKSPRHPCQTAAPPCGMVRLA